MATKTPTKRPAKSTTPRAVVLDPTKVLPSKPVNRGSMAPTDPKLNQAAPSNLTSTNPMAKIAKVSGNIADLTNKKVTDSVQPVTTAANQRVGGQSVGPSSAWLDWEAPTAPDPSGVRMARTGEFSAPSSAPNIGYNRQTSARVIVLAMGVGGAVIMIQGVRGKITNAPGAQVPASLKAFAGVVVAGSVALIVNEVSPDLGMVLGVALLFVALGDGSLLIDFGQRIFGKTMTPGVNVASGGLTTPARPPATSSGQSPSLGHTVQ